jgi:hypothetical protein
MKSRPMIFSTPMVQALLAGRKTQTRRIFKDANEVKTVYPPDFEIDSWFIYDANGKRIKTVGCPYGVVGDRLWVRETTIHAEEYGYKEPIYVASELGDAVLESGLRPNPDDHADVEPHDIKLRRSMFMPRKFCRIYLEITDIWVERVQDICDADVSAEGIEFSGIGGGMNLHQNYCGLWSKINGNQSWIENPWVWVIEFKVVKS